MKLGQLAAMSLAGMLLSSVSVYALTGGENEEDQPVAPAASGLRRAVAQLTGGQRLGPDPQQHTRFVTGSTLRVEGRTGHTQLSGQGSRETYLMYDIRATDSAATEHAPVSMALVIDRSGSMQGSRIDNALEAARGVVDHLGEGDYVTVLSFDTAVTRVVPLSPVTAATREEIKQSISSIRLGGDTCISCGIERAMEELAQTKDRVRRIIVLSDGEANHGVRDEAGFRLIGRQASQQEVAISTVGVGLDYNEKILAAVAFESNARHHFVEDASSLAKVFEAETQDLGATVASQASAEITLAEGVTLLHVFDRQFRQEGNRVVVPLGAFSKGEEKTVLLKVRLSSAAGSGLTKLAELSLRHHDLVRSDPAASIDGRLALLSADRSSDLDPLVLMRIERSRTGAMLKEVNQLFNEGKADEARLKAAEHQRRLRATAAQAQSIAAQSNDSRAGYIDKDFSRQQAESERVVEQLGPKSKPAPKPAATQGRRFTRDNAAHADPYGL